jgi:hypothetical protein
MVSHVQVEPDRWYYHCDRLGMLVWQDMPSMYWEDPFSAGPGYRAPSEKQQHQHELTRMIEASQDWSLELIWALHVHQLPMHAKNIDMDAPVLPEDWPPLLKQFARLK